MIGVKFEPSLNPDILEVKLLQGDESAPDWWWHRLYPKLFVFSPLSNSNWWAGHWHWRIIRRAVGGPLQRVTRVCRIPKRCSLPGGLAVSQVIALLLERLHWNYGAAVTHLGTCQLTQPCRKYGYGAALIKEKGPLLVAEALPFHWVLLK